MKNIKITLLTVLLSTGTLFSAGCSLNNSIAADSATTFVGVGRRIAVEANPLLPASAAGASIGSAVLKHISLQGVKHFAPGQCEPMARSIEAASWGAASNNLAVIAGGGGLLPSLLGVLVWWYVKDYPGTYVSAASFCGNKSRVI